MACAQLLVAPILLSLLIGSAVGDVLFSTLPQTLTITASPREGSVLKAGENRIRVSWGLNATQAARVDDNYTTVKMRLCYAPISQTDRAWRKTKDELSKDKTCQFNIVTRPYTNTQESFEWEVERDIPSATYFVRAYAYDSNGHAVAYGQTTNKQKTSNLFIIEAISGRHTSIDIAAACFSAFSVISLFGFFFAEKRKAKKSSTESNL